MKQISRPYPQNLVQQVWDGSQEIASSQVTLMLPVQGPHFETGTIL